MSLRIRQESTARISVLSCVAGPLYSNYSQLKEWYNNRCFGNCTPTSCSCPVQAHHVLMECLEFAFLLLSSRMHVNVMHSAFSHEADCVCLCVRVRVRVHVHVCIIKMEAAR